MADIPMDTLAREARGRSSSGAHDGGPEDSFEIMLGSVDLRDSFYQFKNRNLASWFCVGMEVPRGPARDHQHL